MGGQGSRDRKAKAGLLGIEGYKEGRGDGEEVGRVSENKICLKMPQRRPILVC